MYNNRLQEFSWWVDTIVAYSLGLRLQQLLQINSHQTLEKTIHEAIFPTQSVTEWFTPLRVSKK